MPCSRHVHWKQDNNTPHRGVAFYQRDTSTLLVPGRNPHLPLYTLIQPWMIMSPRLVHARNYDVL
uniref:Uncharacterized protein n=1 Tax=Lepeophtheirus salmonis TaxID=72036 RepID=A0A0K2TGW7_LEPSM